MTSFSRLYCSNPPPFFNLIAASRPIQACQLLGFSPYCPSPTRLHRLHHGQDDSSRNRLNPGGISPPATAWILGPVGRNFRPLRSRVCPHHRPCCHGPLFYPKNSAAPAPSLPTPGNGGWGKTLGMFGEVPWWVHRLKSPLTDALITARPYTAGLAECEVMRRPHQ